MAEHRPDRPRWDELPEALRIGVEKLLGSEVVEARSQQGGFSPGSADRVVMASGARAFVKAVGSELNEYSPGFHRNEARISAALPESVVVPRLRGVWDDGDWIALVFDDIEGHPPTTPWRRDELLATLDACVAIGAMAVPDGLPHVRDLFAGDLTAWERIATADCPAWASANIQLLLDLAAELDVEGECLLQLDLRADNVVIRPDGTAVVVDWPWAARGPAWLDATTLLFNVRLLDPSFPVDQLIDSHPAFDSVTDARINSLLAMLSGFFLAQSLLPPQKGVETVRKFQRAQADAILVWLEERLGP